MHKYDLTLLYLSAYIMPMHSILATDGLVKHDLAERLRSEIINGSLPPGVRIIERKWALKFGVAQGSIREAIHILAQDGFVTKESGRSARVIHLSEEDVAKLYELRGAIEGLAARLAAAAQPDLTALQATVDAMRQSAIAGSFDGLLDSDLRFHLELCKISGNTYLLERAFLQNGIRQLGEACLTWRVIWHAKSLYWPRMRRPLAGRARLRIIARDPVVHCCEVHQCVRKD